MQQNKTSPLLRYIEVHFDKKITALLEEFINDHKQLFEEKIDKITHITELSIPEPLDYKAVWIDSSIEDDNKEILKFDVAIAAPVNITGYGKYGTLTESTYKWFIAYCEGNLLNGLKDLVVTIDEYSGKSRYKNALSGNLVPIIKREEYDKYAETLLLTYYDEIPEKVKIKDLAKRMGLKLVNHKITKDSSVFGQIYFSDCVQELYDKDIDAMKRYKVSANTIIYDVDAIYLYSIGSKMLTIAHECVHYYLHKKAFLFAKLFDKSLNIIQCETNGGMKVGKETNATTWMEKQANAIAPYILMPTKTFTKKVKEVITKYQCYSDEDVVNNIEMIIQELADFYGVTIYSVRNRMIDIGFDEARGAFNWVDGHYEKPYLFKKGSLKRGESYTVSYKDIGLKLISDRKLGQYIGRGDLVFVENHVCINDKKYITYDDDGIIRLTYYARMNMDECCVKFLYKERGSTDENGYGSFCFLCRDANLGFNFDIDISLDKNGKLENKLDTLKRNEQYLEDLKEMRKIQIMKFPEALKFLKDYLEVSDEDLEFDSGLDERTIRRYFNGENKVPDKKTVIALCRGLRLPLQISSILIQLSGHSFAQNNEEDDLYFLILEGMMGWTPEQVNNYLIESGYEPLTRIKK